MSFGYMKFLNASIHNVAFSWNVVCFSDLKALARRQKIFIFQAWAEFKYVLFISTVSKSKGCQVKHISLNSLVNFLWSNPFIISLIYNVDVMVNILSGVISICIN